MIRLKNKKDFKKLKPNNYLLLVFNKEIKQVVRITRVSDKCFYREGDDLGFPIKDNLDYVEKTKEFYFAKATKKDIPNIIAFCLTN
ncbi:hypothetical protein D3C87_77390 [compost metagenome]